MTDTRDIEGLVKEELGKIAVIYGETYNSPHETYGVLKEEIEEVKKDTDSINLNFEEFWEAVKSDNFGQQKTSLKAMYGKALHGIAELVQVAAVCRKGLR